MIARLDAETRVHHADADAEFDILLGDATSASDYLVFLARVYGFEAPIEAALAMTPSLEFMIELRERQKTGFLAEDLLSLGLHPSDVTEMPLYLGIPQFRGAAEALGWMYVIERSTLAHSMTRNHLLTRLPREMRQASSYLQAYTGVESARWRRFGVVLDNVAHHPAIADRIVTAAREAFRAQRQWLQHDPRPARVAAC